MIKKTLLLPVELYLVRSCGIYLEVCEVQVVQSSPAHGEEQQVESEVRVDFPQDAWRRQMDS